MCGSGVPGKSGTGRAPSTEESSPRIRTAAPHPPDRLLTYPARSAPALPEAGDPTNNPKPREPTELAAVFGPACASTLVAAPRLRDTKHAAQQPYLATALCPLADLPNPQARDALSCLSLFSGCGGLDLGAVTAGFTHVLAVDSDPQAVASYNRNFRHPAIVADLSLARGITDQFAGRVDLVTAGPPCQGFSTVGKRDLEDSRNTLLLDAARLAVAVRPWAILIENVAGALQGRHREIWQAAESVLRLSGFSSATLRLDVSTLGVPQRRKRIFLVAWRSGWDGRLELAKEHRVSLATALHQVEHVSDHTPRPFPLGSHASLVARAISQGQKLSNVRSGARAVHTWDIPDAFGYVTPAERLTLEGLLRLRRRDRARSYGDADPVQARRLSKHLGMPVSPMLRSLIRKRYVRRVGNLYDLTHTYNGRYRRPQASDVSPTVDTKFVQGRYFLHPYESRGFTTREAARLQTFPDWFALHPSDKAAARLIGNAVPPVAAFRMVDLVRTRLLDK